VGVSTYERLYNLTWMNNGYHAEHRFRSKVHWTKMPELHQKIRTQQNRAGTRVIRPPHPLGFLESGPADPKDQTPPPPGFRVKVTPSSISSHR
jgi:hypothetical protein